MNRRQFDLMAVGGGIAVGTLLFVALPVATIQSREEVTCIVQEKDRTTKSTSEGSKSDMRIYTTDCGVLSVEDSLLAFRFDAADRYAQIEPGHRYTFTTQGWRVPFFSSFPNIIEIKDAPQ